jgi:hypothetical protein
MANPSGPPTSLDSLLVAGVPTIGAAGLPLTNGNYWFVNSVTGSNGNTGNASNSPYATTAQAVASASAGDVIVWQEGHAETISAAGGITVSKTGLTFVGLGEGATRPTFTFATSTAATFLITGASTAILGNIICVCNIASLVTGFNVQAANCTLGTQGSPVVWQDTSSAVSALRAVLTSAAASNFNCNLTYKGLTATSVSVNAVRLVGVANGIVNVTAYGKFSAAIVEFYTTACTNIVVTGYFYNSGTTNLSKNVIDTITGSTWYANGWDGAAGQVFDGGSASAIAPSDPTALLSISENVAATSAAIISNGLALFTITGGPVQILALLSICQTANNSTASTLQYSSTGTLGSTTQTISGASASLASAAAGTSVILQGTALSTAPVVNANGAGLAETTNIIVPAGSLTAVVGVGFTTGTWIHYIRYRPLAKGATVTNAF